MNINLIYKVSGHSCSDVPPDGKRPCHGLNFSIDGNLWSMKNSKIRQAGVFSLAHPRSVIMHVVKQPR